MRTIALVLAVWVLSTGTTGRAAEDPPKKLTPEERGQLEAKLQEMETTGSKQYQAREYAKAAKSWEEGLAIARRLYPKEEYANGHQGLGDSLSNLAMALQAQQKFQEAESLFRDALAMRRRLVKGDHPDLATSMNNLASVLEYQAKYAEAEALYREGLAMRRRLFQGDHPSLAVSLGNLALVLEYQGEWAEAESLCREALAMRRRLFQGDHPALAINLGNLAIVLKDQGKYAEAEPFFQEALAMARRLFKGDHPSLAVSLGNLGGMLHEQGKYAEAEIPCREALEMHRRLFKGDHPRLASNLGNLAMVLKDQGKYAEAEPLLREALAMNQRMFPGDHPNLALSLSNLARVLEHQGKCTEAETLCREALAMRRRLFQKDHPEVAISLNNLAMVQADQGSFQEAETICREALAMRHRLFQRDHPHVVDSMSLLATVLQAQGKYAEAEPLRRDALAMQQRLLKGDHPNLVVSRINLARVLLAQGKYAEAEPLCRDALAMHRGLVEKHARVRTEGQVLTYFSIFPDSQHVYLSCVRALQAAPESVYPEVWASKGAIARVYERRSLASRAAASDPRAAALLTQLTDLRRRRADLILAPQSRDLATRQKRDEDLKDLADRIAVLDHDLRPLLPALNRNDRLARATPVDLQKALPRDAVFIDLLAYILNEQDPKVPGKEGEKKTWCYLAFVVSRDAIRWIDLGPAAPIDTAIALWREAITTSPHAVAADLPARVRELVWVPLRRVFPDGIRVVYLSPDLSLSRVPWCALPGDQPGRLVLEEFAVAVIPHGPFLLDQLWPQDPAPAQAKEVLVAGGASYGEAPRSADAATVAGNRSAPPVKPGQPLTWRNLPAAAEEARAVAARADRKQLGARLLLGADASADRVLAELPRARFAHLATHGFFADPQFRSVLQADPEQFKMVGRGERVGPGALSPLVLSGLVFAGANRPETPYRGLVTGESLIDRDLSGLELAVLSACDTGRGEVAGGEGVFSLQRAFHLAGCKNVIASQWKVNDAATAALMGEFYRALWEENLPPIKALQQAQLAVYRADPKEFTEMARRGFGAGDKDLDAAKVAGAAPVQPGGRNLPVLWAAFTLSGAGR